MSASTGHYPFTPHKNKIKIYTCTINIKFNWSTYKFNTILLHFYFITSKLKITIKGRELREGILLLSRKIESRKSKNHCLYFGFSHPHSSMPPQVDNFYTLSR